MKHLIIGPGSMIIYSFLGAVKYLSDEGLLNNLEEISCSSAGSIIGFMYVFFKGDVKKLFDLSLDIPLDTIAKPDIKSLVSKFGLIDTDRFEKYMITVTNGIDPTFKELYAINPIKLHIPTCDIVTNKTIYMSVDTTPDMKVAHAVRRSIAVPIIMTPASKRYVDGSLKEYSPFVPFLGKNDVLEIRYMYENESPKTRPKTFIQFLYLTVLVFISNRVEYLNFPRIDITTGSDFNLFDFSMSLEKKLQLYVNGYYQTKRGLPACYRKNHDPSEEDPKSPACLYSQYTHDPEPQSEDPHHLVACDSDEMCNLDESPLQVPQEIHL